ncbi:spermidine synthase [Sphingomonas sp. AR_OL41]|uniref:spermidine synthase n=1 Tax=Sphingomonas sp. AR_OL41 TaxID=3042729 RepID=UPI0024805787|nr:spermidine synthase [Sphingomonas sp. AR_OL41]MDH7973300.1 spermidine synthase [Sphingomonas sp. AR_OL41]
MHASEHIDTADIPGGGQLRLMRYGKNFSIEFGEDELMGSQAPQSEQALADLAAHRTAGKQDRVLIGGLGMGFTLGAALTAFPAHTRIVVAELVPQVVTWAKGPLAHLFGDYLSDPRVTIAVRDVHDVIAAAPGGFDAILLDVDNGPDGFIHPANDRLYCNWGLRDAHAALRPGGVLAIWSAYRDDAFVERLKAVGFSVEEATVPDGGNAERSPYTIWLAGKAAEPARQAALAAA